MPRRSAAGSGPFSNDYSLDHWKGRSGHHPRHRGIPVVRALRRPGRALPLGGSTRVTVRVGLSLPASRCHIGHGDTPRKSSSIPLPHPSPLNRRWYSRFPAMLADRLAEVRKDIARCGEDVARMAAIIRIAVPAEIRRGSRIRGSPSDVGRIVQPSDWMTPVG